MSNLSKDVVGQKLSTIDLNESQIDTLSREITINPTSQPEWRFTDAAV
jgi:hypothetical protein